MKTKRYWKRDIKKALNVTGNVTDAAISIDVNFAYFIRLCKIHNVDLSNIPYESLERGVISREDYIESCSFILVNEYHLSQNLSYILVTKDPDFFNHCYDHKISTRQFCRMIHDKFETKMKGKNDDK